MSNVFQNLNQLNKTILNVHLIWYFIWNCKFLENYSKKMHINNVHFQFLVIRLYKNYLKKLLYKFFQNF